MSKGPLQRGALQNSTMCPLYPTLGGSGNSFSGRNDFQSERAWSLRSGISSGKIVKYAILRKKWGSAPAPPLVLTYLFLLSRTSFLFPASLLAGRRLDIILGVPALPSTPGSAISEFTKPCLTPNHPQASNTPPLAVSIAFVAYRLGCTWHFNSCIIQDGSGDSAEGDKYSKSTSCNWAL